MKKSADYAVKHTKNYGKENTLILGNLGVLNTKMSLKTDNWLWFTSYGRNHVRTSYRSADDTELLPNVTSAESHNIAQKEFSAVEG
jgi:hypothetical protein